MGTRIGRLIGVMALAVALSTTAGCLGSNKNFSTEGAATTTFASGLIGKQAPEFSLQTLDGKTFKLSDLRGKSIMINFWATWCPPCREEMPVLQKAYPKYKDQGFEFLGIDLKEDAGTVRDFVAKGGYSWTFLLDGSGQVSNSYQVSGVPTTYFIDREGIVQSSFIGPIPESVLATKLDAIK